MELPQLMLQDDVFIAAAALVDELEFSDLSSASHTAVIVYTAAVNHVEQV